MTSPNCSLSKWVVIVVDTFCVVDAEAPNLAPFFIVSPSPILNSKLLAKLLVVSISFCSVTSLSFSSIEIFIEEE
ncbi:hypothetical protein K210099B7_46080 [Bacteroides xylanisolvens]|jgi:hypothetical protein